MENGKFEKNWSKLEEIYKTKSAENKNVLNVLCDAFEANNKKNLPKKLKELKDLIDNEKFIRSISLYRNNFVIEGDEHSKYIKDFGNYINTELSKAKDLSRSKIGDCGEYAMQILKLLVIEKNSKLKKRKNTDYFFKNFFIVKTEESHRFVVIVTQTDECILVDGWDYNLICNFDTKDLLKNASLDCLRGLEIDRYAMKIVYESFYKNDRDVKKILDGLEKVNVLSKRFSKIDNDLKKDKDVRSQFKVKCESHLNNMLNLIGEREDSNLSGKIETVFHLLSHVNNGVDNKDKILLDSKILEKVLLKLSDDGAKKIYSIKDYVYSLECSGSDNEKFSDSDKEKFISIKMTEEIDNLIKLEATKNFLNLSSFASMSLISH
jgi:hypothetical protein